MREAITYRGGEAVLFGTYHRPSTGSDTAPALRGGASAEHSSAGTRRVGFLFLNTGHAPRAGHGAFIARLGDALAARGAHVFRFDFPGCGDSPGEVPALEDVFWRYLQTGGFDAVTAELIRWLTRTYQLESIVSSGMCGGGVVAIMAADRCPDEVAGLLLMEPAFTVATTTRGRIAGGAEYSSGRLVGATKQLRKSLLSPKSWWRALSGRSQYAHHIRTVRTWTSYLLRRMRGDDLPADFNRPQIAAYNRVLQRRPALVLNATDSPTEAVYLTVHRQAVSQSTAKMITLRGIPRANHTFTTPGADDIAVERIMEWATTRGFVQ